MQQGCSLSLLSICRMSEEDILEFCCKLRWPEQDGKPHCPYCGCGAIYHSKTRTVFVCQLCSRQFRVTTGTVLAYHKLSLREHLMATILFAQNPSGCSVAMFAKMLGVRYRTALLILARLRAAVNFRESSSPLESSACDQYGVQFECGAAAAVSPNGIWQATANGEAWVPECPSDERRRQNVESATFRLLHEMFAPVIVPLEADRVHSVPRRSSVG